MLISDLNMIENIWGWVNLTVKYSKPCLICHVEIPEGDNAKWKKNIGIAHPECIDKAKELENLKDQALAKYHLGQNDGAEILHKKIQQIETQLNYVRSVEELWENIGDGTFRATSESLEVLMNALDKNKELKEYANKSKTAFKRKFKPIFYDLVKNATQQTFEEKYMKKICSIFAEINYRKWRLHGQFVLDGTKPHHDRAQYKEIVNSAQTTSKKLEIVDKYFNKDSLHLLMLVLDLENSDVEKIKILTSLIRMESKIDDELKDLFEKFKTELKEDWEADCQMKVMCSEELTAKVHDRFYLSSRPENSFTVGSASYIFEKANTISRLNDVEGGKFPAFDDWWDDKDALDIIEDWDEISKRRDALLLLKQQWPQKTHGDWKCSNPSCNNKVKSVLNTIIERGIPILCVECRQTKAPR